MKEIIIINGTGGSGKDTFVTYCSEIVKVRNFSSVDKVKEVARLAGWNGEKDEKSRKFLSDLKKLTTEYNDMPFVDMVNSIEAFKKSDEEVMFIHIREPENIERAVKVSSAKTLLIKRNGLHNIESNVSDSEVDNYNYDYVIINDTLDSLKAEAKKFIEELKNNGR